MTWKTMAGSVRSELDPILLHHGIGPIVFGDCHADVIAALGPNCEERTRPEGDVDLLYPGLGLEFTFWADCSQRLGIIKTLRPSATLLGRKLVGGSEDDIFRFVEVELRAVVTSHDGCIHEDESVQSWIEVDQLDLSFWFDDGRLHFIDWTCAWKVGDTPDWPRKSR